MTKATIREVTEKDYPFIHELLYETWYKDKKEHEEFNRALAEMYLNHCLNMSSLGLVAELYGEKVGFLLARVDDEEPELRKFQTDPYQALLSILSVSESERADQITYLKRELTVNAEMLEESGKEFDAEICLFIVSPAAQGMGIGNHLFEEVLDEFKRLGVNDYYLYTDDGCNIQFYEKRKMYRASTRAFNPTETLEKSAFNLYLYRNEK